jgi:hypothetical protein
VLTTPATDAYAAVTNTDFGIVAGYVYDRAIYPWIALWEENCARMDVPWRGLTQVRGVEFGNSPMPLGLEYARNNSKLFDTSTYSTLAPGESSVVSYSLFASATERSDITGITRQGSKVHVGYASGEVLAVPNSLFGGAAS